MITIDFETDAIEARPKYPPKPVGVAIWEPGKNPQYMAWGHPEGNNCTMLQAKRKLASLWKQDLLFHNAKFDLDVAEVHMGLPLPAWDRVHDTLFLLFLTDPHAASLSLKPSAERLLGMEPEERDAVRDWLATHGIIAANQNPGPFISKAPADLVGKYAMGDLIRTKALYDKLYKGLDARERRAYDRERRLLPILLANERIGLRINVDQLAEDVEVYEHALTDADIWLRKKLRSDSLNLDSDAEVAAILKQRKIVTQFVKTPTGRDSTAKKNMTPDKFNDQSVAQVLGYRNRLTTVLSMSMRPWLEQAGSGGYIFTEWNQVRQSHGNDGSKGARTGRLSCSRFMNITKDFLDKGDGYAHPTALSLPALPLVRKYIVGDPGHVWATRDFASQEYRVLAHFESDGMLDAYKDDPRMDVHEYMRETIKTMTGVDLSRRTAKMINFALLYGAGVGKLAASLGVDVDTARRLRDAHRKAAPGVALLDKELKRRGREGEPVRTWGGRRYFCEAPKMIGNQKRTFEYKMLNYIVQGSAADATKEAIIRYADTSKDGRLTVTVHDEIDISVPPGKLKSEMAILNRAMQSLEFDVIMLSDGSSGPSWGEQSDYVDPT